MLFLLYTTSLLLLPPFRPVPPTKTFVPASQMSPPRRFILRLVVLLNEGDLGWSSPHHGSSKRVRRNSAVGYWQSTNPEICQKNTWASKYLINSCYICLPDSSRFKNKKHIMWIHHYKWLGHSVENSVRPVNKSSCQQFKKLSLGRKYEGNGEWARLSIDSNKSEMIFQSP